MRLTALRRLWKRCSFIQKAGCCLLLMFTILFWIKWHQTNLFTVELSVEPSQAATNKIDGVSVPVPISNNQVQQAKPEAPVEIIPQAPSPIDSSENRDHRLAVLKAMNHSWTAYRLYAWGADEVHPLTKSSSMWMNAALTMIDSLDTICMMGMHKEFEEALAWIKTPGNLEFNTNKDHVNVFETIIRILGGLLGAYHCRPETIFITKAINLADRLVVAFNTPTGMPYSDVNLARRTAQTPLWTTESSLAEITTIQLELNELSRLVGNRTYADLGMRALNKVISIAGNRGLLPIMIDPISGSIRGNRLISMGARGDSFYEYLLKVWVQSGKKENQLKDQYLKAIQEMKYKLLKRTKKNGWLFVGELSGGIFSAKMDHLVCFLPGTLVYGVMHGMPQDHLTIAKELMLTCYQMYHQQGTGLAPEIAYFRWSGEKDPPAVDSDINVQPLDAFNILRPETVESLFYLYRYTRDPQYRQWGWEIFQAFEKYAKLPEAGYVGVDGITDPRHLVKRTKCESFWYAETLKYFYLLFHEASNGGGDQVLLPLDKWVISTEAHAFPLQSS